MLRLKEKRKELAAGSTRKLTHYPWHVKLEVVLEALNSRTTQAEVSRKFGVSQPIISVWKRSAIECLEAHFRSGNQVKKRAPLIESYEGESTSCLAEAVHRLADVLQRVENPAISGGEKGGIPPQSSSS